MTERLFVYGTLAPGRPNEHVLAAVGGVWQPATMRGHLRPLGWGADLGYPGLLLDAGGDAIDGFVFASEGLADAWAMLDAFEGAEYRRVAAPVALPDGRSVEAWVYVLR